MAIIVEGLPAPPAPPAPSPLVQLSVIRPGIALLQPLSRRGHGPGLIVVSPSSSSGGATIKDGIPSLLMKWAEEGYTVIELGSEAFVDGKEPLEEAIAQFSQCENCQPKGKIGLIG
jgi:carboxymethylenebutenolidase